jgi:hypothetical protein
MDVNTFTANIYKLRINTWKVVSWGIENAAASATFYPFVNL